MEFPGAPRTPMSCTFGRVQSPIAEMFELPKRSSCDAPSMACRRPDHTRSNTARNGRYPSTTFSSLPAPSGSGLATRYASPSLVISRGSNVAFASRAPIVGHHPNALARISPSPRHASAHATTQYSSSVGPSLTANPRLVLLLVHVEVLRPERRPRLRVPRRLRVLTLERLVAPVVRPARREVLAVRRLHYTDGHEPVHPQRMNASLLQQAVGIHDPLGTQGPPLRHHQHHII